MADKVYVLFDGDDYIGTAGYREELTTLASSAKNPRVVIGVERSLRVETRLTFGDGTRKPRAPKASAPRIRKDGKPAKKPGRKPKAAANGGAPKPGITVTGADGAPIEGAAE